MDRNQEFRQFRRPVVFFHSLWFSCLIVGLSSCTQPRQTNPTAELFSEMVQIIQNQEMSDAKEFYSWVDSIDQGASIIGVYNALTHSARYRELEGQTPQASPKAVHFFAREMDEIQTVLGEKTFLNPRDARPQKKNEMPSVVRITEERKEIRFPETLPMGRVAYYEKIFAQSSPYTLRRVLGDGYLRILESMTLPEKSKWYGSWAAKMAALGVDFGLPKRNRREASFHGEWAQRAKPDRLAWEVLNRGHRVIHAYSQ